MEVEEVLPVMGTSEVAVWYPTVAAVMNVDGLVFVEPLTDLKVDQAQHILVLLLQVRQILRRHFFLVFRHEVHREVDRTENLTVHQIE